MHTRGQVHSSRVDEHMLLDEKNEVFGLLHGCCDDNPRRMVALWNMADRLNLSTEFIEDGGVDELVERIKHLLDWDKRVERAVRLGQDGLIEIGNRNNAMSALFATLSKMGR